MDLNAAGGHRGPRPVQPGEPPPAAWRLPEADRRRCAGDMARGIDGELRRLGAWQPSSPPPPDPAVAGPFGMRTMAFEQWLQVVLVPRLRELATSDAPFPPRGTLAAHAVREFDGRDDCRGLIDLLAQVDELSPPRLDTSARAAGAPAGVVALLLVTVLGGAGLALWGTLRIGEWMAYVAPRRVLLNAHASEGQGHWRSLHMNAWGDAAPGGTLRFADATLSVASKPAGAALPPLLRVVQLDLTAVPPRLVQPAEAASEFEFSAAGIARVSADDRAPASAESTAALQLLDHMARGCDRATLSDSVRALLRTIDPRGGDTLDLRDYPRGLSDVAFAGVFAALFVPLAVPLVWWQVRRHRRRPR